MRGFGLSIFSLECFWLTARYFFNMQTVGGAQEEEDCKYKIIDGLSD